ncbi:unnamed protein product [Cyprideis torosa]|uniref:Uncharacterized protein n=1 Tax=Cyprideis torosa TaxID=163714 RepID=A0A7R8W4W2_9CRUS|nr:unnamed protein product [Cyprideis torosa]CAG0884605.1 unnamed protein product [Cyprideis torosa]
MMKGLYLLTRKRSSKNVTGSAESPPPSPVPHSPSTKLKSSSRKHHQHHLRHSSDTRVLEMGNRACVPSPDGEECGVSSIAGTGEDGEMELPPPMRVLPAPLVVPQQSEEDVSRSPKSAASTLNLEPLKLGASVPAPAEMATEIENIVKRGVEHHSERGADESGFSEQQRLDTNSPSSNAATNAGFLEKPTLPSAEQRAKCIRKRTFVIQELVDTEKDYVKHLGLIVDNYMRSMRDSEFEIPMPEDLKDGKDKIIFGNLEAIYEWHQRTFSKDLERCIEHPEELGPLFKKHERKLNIYIKYCENKPKSDYIVADYIDSYFEDLRQKFGHKLQLPDLLIKPVQRIMKYQLLLKDILSLTKEAGLKDEVDALNKAVQIMHYVPKAADDMMNIGRLRGFEGKITAQGTLKCHGPMMVQEGPNFHNLGKHRELQVFVFEQSIFFAEEVGKKTQFSNPDYIYQRHLQINKTSLKEMDDDPECLKFAVQSTVPSVELVIVCTASSPEERDEWVGVIRNLLDVQNKFLNAIQSPIAYQKELRTLRNVHFFNHEKGRKEKSVDLLAVRLVACRQVLEVREVESILKNTICFRDAGDDSEWLTPSSFRLSTLPKRASSQDRDHGPAKSGDLSPKRKNRSFHLPSSSSGASGDVDGYASDSEDGPRQGRSKRTFLDGLLTKRSEDRAERRRWSESQPKEGGPRLSPGAITRVLMNYTSSEGEPFSVSKGENLQVLQFDPEKGYLVRKVEEMSCEGWIPGFLLSSHSDGGRKPWSLKFRKPSFTSKKEKDQRAKPGAASLSPPLPVGMVKPMVAVPSFIKPPDSLNCCAGQAASFSCEYSPHVGCEITWQHPSGFKILPSEDGTIRVSCPAPGCSQVDINPCRASDSGVYLCTVTNACGDAVHAEATLTVNEKLNPPEIPTASLDPDGTLVELTWKPPVVSSARAITGYLVEMCREEDGDWETVSSMAPEARLLIPNLHPNQEVRFRVSAINALGTSDPSPPSAPVRIPLPKASNNRKQQLIASPSRSRDASPSSSLPISGSSTPQENGDRSLCKAKLGFERSFRELEEVARGRFSVVKKYWSLKTSREVAVKCYRRHLKEETIKEEYMLHSSLKHRNIINVIGLYKLRTGTYALVLDFVCGRTVFEHTCRRRNYPESTVAAYLKQLFLALAYLQKNSIVHCDLRPEHLLADISKSPAVLKLIDFGSAISVWTGKPSITPPRQTPNPEFTAPECLDTSNSKETSQTHAADLWAAGVILYVFLSGVSPFLDDSPEETTDHILRLNYSFPSEYFSEVSASALSLIKQILVVNPSQRLSAEQCLQSSWIIEGFQPKLRGPENNAVDK